MAYAFLLLVAIFSIVPNLRGTLSESMATVAKAAGALAAVCWVAGFAIQLAMYGTITAPPG